MLDWIKDKETVIWKKHSVWISLIINIVLIIITGALVYCTYKLYSTSQDSVKHSQESLNLTQKSVKQQGDYYEATVRPFVNYLEDSITCPKQDFSQRDIIDFEYIIKNYGSIPAKDVQSSAFFLSYEDSTYKKEFDPGDVRYAIYPNMTQRKQANNLPIKYNKDERSFLHIAINYNDMAENKHNSLSIIWFKIENDEPKFQLLKTFFD